MKINVRQALLSTNLPQTTYRMFKDAKGQNLDTFKTKSLENACSVCSLGAIAIACYRQSGKAINAWRINDALMSHQLYLVNLNDQKKWSFKKIAAAIPADLEIETDDFEALRL